MARLRDQPPPQPSRRSTRIASKASSRASSVAASDDHSKPQKTTKKAVAVATAVAAAPTFNVVEVIRRIVILGERHTVDMLTNRQKDEVINALADREIALKRNHKAEVDRLEEEVEDLERNRMINEVAKASQQVSQPLRDHFLYQKIGSSTNGKVTSSDSPEKEPPTPAQDSTFGDSQMVSSTPLTSAQPVPYSSAQQPETSITLHDSSTPPRNDITETPKPNLLRRAFGLLSSPFGTIRKLGSSTQPHRPSLLQNGMAQDDVQEPLGALPALRKRSAPESEPEVEQEPVPTRVDFSVINLTPSRNKIAKTPRTARGGPSTKDYALTTPLGDISEYTEPSETNVQRPEPTPSRKTPARHRDIASVRRRREEAAYVPKPVRAWDPKPLPREPNADNRLLKLQHYHDVKEELRSLQKDAELKDMIRHRVKRVKVDDLVSIPHNRPGEPSGTFRMYEADSDDEMEVDESAEVRDNVFDEDGNVVEKPEEASAEHAAVPSPQEASQTQEVPQMPQQSQATVVDEEEIPEGVELMTFNFPDLGTRDPNEPPSDPLGAVKFAFGYQHWLRTKENLAWLWEQDGFGDYGA